MDVLMVGWMDVRTCRNYSRSSLMLVMLHLHGCFFAKVLFSTYYFYFISNNHLIYLIFSNFQKIETHQCKVKVERNQNKV